MIEATERAIQSAELRRLALIGGGALGLALILIVAWYLLLRTDMTPAFTDLKPADAALIVDELKRQKTPYELRDSGSTILVARDQVDATRVAILGSDLPLKGTVGFELFSKSDIGLTEFAQKINYQRALQGELARTLMSLANIDTARVHITLPETGIFEQDHRRAKASVTITPKLGCVLDARTVRGIQELVASAVSDLDEADVTVLDSAGRPLTADMSEFSNESYADGGDELARTYRDKVRSVAMSLTDDPAMRVSVVVANVSPMKPDQPIGTNVWGKRTNALRIRIALSDMPAATLHEQLASRLQAEIGFDPEAGDSLVLTTLPAGMAPQSASTVSSLNNSPSDGVWSSTRPLGPIWWLAVGLTIVGTICAFAIWRRRPTLSASARNSFAVRLRELLDEDERLRSGS